MPSTTNNLTGAGVRYESPASGRMERMITKIALALGLSKLDPKPPAEALIRSAEVIETGLA